MCSYVRLSIPFIGFLFRTARFDRNDNVVLNSISKKLRPVFVIEGSC